jgi:16S rRNA (guanine(966)-N(2))-methyltransferase RsmD
MRIITGSARGAKLETLDGIETRPTAERVKEAIFSMIQFEIDGKRVLDLFAGSGQMGLEALSRGALKATFVDASREAADIVKNNAKKTGLFERSVVLATDYKAFIRGNVGRARFDIVFLDPPYESDFVEDAIERLKRADMLEEGCVIICESDRKEPFSSEGFVLRRHARYGKIYVTVLEKQNGEEQE